MKRRFIGFMLVAMAIAPFAPAHADPIFGSSGNSGTNVASTTAGWPMDYRLCNGSILVYTDPEGLGVTTPGYRGPLQTQTVNLPTGDTYYINIRDVMGKVAVAEWDMGYVPGQWSIWIYKETNHRKGLQKGGYSNLPQMGKDGVLYDQDPCPPAKHHDQVIF